MKNGQAIEERLGTSPDGAPAERQFVCGLRYIDDCVLRDRDTNSDGSLDERLYGIQDANWNVTAIIDETGAVQERYAYAAYGQPMFLTPTFADRTSSSSAWESLYCSYRYESATGVFHVRNRVYHPVVGVWVQRDPFRSDSFSISNILALYSYTEASPLALTDMLGLQGQTPVPFCCKAEKRIPVTPLPEYCKPANFDGCSAGVPQSWSFFVGGKHYVVPVKQACLRHDSCYRGCGKERGECDWEFHEDMRALCEISIPRSAFGAMLRCYNMAYYYYVGVYWGGALSLAYNKGQTTCCKC